MSPGSRSWVRPLQVRIANLFLNKTSFRPLDTRLLWVATVAVDPDTGSAQIVAGVHPSPGGDDAAKLGGAAANLPQQEESRRVQLLWFLQARTLELISRLRSEGQLYRQLSADNRRFLVEHDTATNDVTVSRIQVGSDPPTQPPHHRVRSSNPNVFTRPGLL